MAAQDKQDWTTQGMTEREMKSRIKSHREMAYKAAEVAVANQVPKAFLSENFRTWAKNNPQSPFIAGGGMQALQDQAERSYLARERYISRTNTAISMTKALEAKKAAKLKKDLNKLIQGY